MNTLQGYTSKIFLSKPALYNSMALLQMISKRCGSSKYGERLKELRNLTISSFPSTSFFENLGELTEFCTEFQPFMEFLSTEQELDCNIVKILLETFYLFQKSTLIHSPKRDYESDLFENLCLVLRTILKITDVYIENMKEDLNSFLLEQSEFCRTLMRNKNLISLMLVFENCLSLPLEDLSLLYFPFIHRLFILMCMTCPNMRTDAHLCDTSYFPIMEQDVSISCCGFSKKYSIEQICVHLLSFIFLKDSPEMIVSPEELDFLTWAFSNVDSFIFEVECFRRLLDEKFIENVICAICELSETKE
jgi:hypothetical protein